MPFQFIDVQAKPANFGNLVGIADLVDALAKANFPPQAVVPVDTFKRLVTLVDDDLVFRSTETGRLYIDVMRCQISYAATREDVIFFRST